MLAKQGKLRMSLVPPQWNKVLAEVMDFGARKHGDFTWLTSERNFSDLIDATKRHILAWEQGLDDDTESELPHLAHAASNLLMLYYYSSIFTHTPNANDDRMFNNIGKVQVPFTLQDFVDIEQKNQEKNSPIQSIWTKNNDKSCCNESDVYRNE